MSTWKNVVKFSTGKDSTDNAALADDRVDDAIDRYNILFEENRVGEDAEAIEDRQKEYAPMVNGYYDLVTDFYEYGWGQSFHFARRFKGEAFAASIARHEHYLAMRAGIKPGMQVLDVGCGIGGPMREIARFTQASVTGVNNNQYQVSRCNLLNAQAGLDNIAKAVKGDFMKLPFQPELFDVCYAIEATCHAPDKVGCYSQMFKVLKPGGVFVGFEWVMTDSYDEKNEEHRLVKHGIETGNALPNLERPADVRRSLEAAGFVVEDMEDKARTAAIDGNDVTWFNTLQGSFSFSQLKHTWVGRTATQFAVDVLETLRVAPKGTSKTHKMLRGAADSLVRGGELGVFTPMLFFMARKPVE